MEAADQNALSPARSAQLREHLLTLLGADLGTKGSPGWMAAEDDWLDLLELAAWHAVLPALARGVTAAGLSLPPSVSARLHDALRDIAQHNAVLAMEMVRVCRVLEEEGLAVLTFKGVATALQLYGSLAGRSAGDIDLLVAEAEFERAVGLLAKHGYEQKELYPPSLQASLWNAQRRVSIDLHWGVPPARFGFNTTALWQQVQRLNVLGTPVPTLSPEHALLVLAVNIVKEPWPPPMHQLVDFAHVVNCRDTLDWEAVLREAKRLGCQRILAVTMMVVHRLWRIETPFSLGRLHPAPLRLAPCADEILVQLHQAAPADGTPRPRIFRRWAEYHGQLQDDLTGRLTLMLRRVLEPTAADRAWLPLPGSLDLLYWLLRPLRVLSRALGSGRRR